MLRDYRQSWSEFVVWVDEYLHRAALTFLEARADKTASLRDAVRFLLMTSWGIDEALTTAFLEELVRSDE
jgi:hypothetical protein